jgi:NADPH:quinone reductase-like Zn-dependent oxidoreductase
MQIVRVDRPGAHERLRLVQTVEPPCGPGQVKIDVAAAGVNFADVLVRMGLYRSAREYVGWPITPGFEVAGVVRDVGPDVARYAVGDRVFGVTASAGMRASWSPASSTFARSRRSGVPSKVRASPRCS